MIFRRRQRETEATSTSSGQPASGQPASGQPASGQPAATDTAVADEVGQGTAEPAAEPTTTGDAEVDLAALDAQASRDLGPYDIAEVDEEALDEPDPEQPRIDLGSIVLRAMKGSELRLQVDEASQQIVSAMMIRGDSALEVGAFAAPRSGGLWQEIRAELKESAEQAGGSANLVPGPFGVELRRLLPVRTPDGQQGYQPSRMWVAEGPRWMLRGIIYGQAALEDGLESPVAEMLEAFRQVVVRRGEEAMAPGDLLPLSMPENMTRQGPEDNTTDSGNTGE